MRNIFKILLMCAAVLAFSFYAYADDDKAVNPALSEEKASPPEGVLAVVPTEGAAISPQETTAENEPANCHVLRGSGPITGIIVF